MGDGDEVRGAFHRFDSAVGVGGADGTVSSGARGVHPHM